MASASVLLVGLLLPFAAVLASDLDRGLNLGNLDPRPTSTAGPASHQQRLSDLFVRRPGADTSSIAACKLSPAILSCERVDVNRHAFVGADQLRINGVMFARSGAEGKTKMFVSDDRDVSTAFVRLWPTRGGGRPDLFRKRAMTGVFETEDGHYRLQPCGKDCHVLMKVNMTSNEMDVVGGRDSLLRKVDQLRQLTDVQVYPA